MPAYASAKTRAGRNRQVLEGRAMRTCPGGLQAHDLKLNKSGKVVSKKASAAGKKSFDANNLKRYCYE